MEDNTSFKHKAHLVYLGGGFKYVFMFTTIWGRFPIWLDDVFICLDGLKPPISLLMCFLLKFSEDLSTHLKKRASPDTGQKHK